MAGVGETNEENVLVWRISPRSPQEETPDPTAEVTEGFKGIQDNLVSALSKEMKFEQLVESEEVQKEEKKAV